VAHLYPLRVLPVTQVHALVSRENTKLVAHDDMSSDRRIFFIREGMWMDTIVYSVLIKKYYFTSCLPNSELPRLISLKKIFLD